MSKVEENITYREKAYIKYPKVFNQDIDEALTYLLPIIQNLDKEIQNKKIDIDQIHK